MAQVILRHKKVQEQLLKVMHGRASLDFLFPGDDMLLWYKLERVSDSFLFSQTAYGLSFFLCYGCLLSSFLVLETEER